jgi:hypothetical protein
VSSKQKLIGKSQGHPKETVQNGFGVVPNDPPNHLNGMLQGDHWLIFEQVHVMGK